MACEFTWPPRLDRRVCVTGVYDSIMDWTTWTLPFIDGTVNRIVLSDCFGAMSNAVIRPDWISRNVIYVYDLDLSAGPAAIGRLYPASIELTKPYVRDSEGKADVDARVTNRQLTTSHFETKAYQHAVAIERRAEVRRRDFSSLERTDGTLKSWVNGDMNEQRQFIIGQTPEPFTVTGVEHVVDYSPRMGDS